jgi:hypothetical protein
LRYPAPLSALRIEIGLGENFMHKMLALPITGVEEESACGCAGVTFRNSQIIRGLKEQYDAIIGKGGGR